MSAITGIFIRNGKDVDPELMKKMNEKLSHRGPDGSAIWCDGPMGLGHQMLWTTQESLHEKLPLEENNLVITADARIDNRDELSKELGLKDEEDVSDSYFILKAYEMWGEDCPDKLLGDFAFAIWDKEKEKLFCARDHMGVKPFYYYLDEDMFVFGTEIKALFCVEGVPQEINEKGVGLYLTLVSDNKSNFYKNIYTLMPAHIIKTRKDESQIKKYWNLDPDYELIMDTEDDYKQAFLEIFEKAVSCRMRSAFLVGYELSGGMDSSSIVCAASKQLGKNLKLKTFSIVFDFFPKSDEREFINSVIDKYNINSILIFGDKIKPLKDIKKIFQHQEQPFFSPFITTKWAVYHKMKKHDIRVVLSGTGGDAVISYGDYYLKELATNFRWYKLFKEIKGFSKRSNVSFINIFLQKVFFPLIPEYFKKLLPSNSKKQPNVSILNPEFEKKMNINKSLNDIYWNPYLEANNPKKMHYFLIKSFFDIHALEVENKSTSAFNLEPRYPFLDKRLVEFCYAIPTSMKFKGGWSRYILRIAMEGILPKKNQWRPYKYGIEDVYVQNFLLFEKELLNKIIFKNKVIDRYVNLKEIESTYLEFKKGYSGMKSMDIWLVTLTYLWLKDYDSGFK